MSPDQFGSTTSPVLATVSIDGELTDAAAARLVRWCEARLHLHDIGQAPTSHLLIDLSHVRHARLSALAILDHARTEAERRRVGIHLIGAGTIMATSPAQVRHCLGRWRNFPTLDVARATLAPAGGDNGRGPVDPDAIVFMRAIHDHLR
jgi:ABC-type transporter Mla MlaB component